jgi:hypothetical protein
MTFPVAPINGDTTTVNGISYVYDSSLRSWTRVTSTLGNITVSNNANITGNLTVGGNVTADRFTTTAGVFYANNTSYNSDVASLSVAMSIIYGG